MRRQTIVRCAQLRAAKGGGVLAQSVEIGVVPAHADGARAFDLGQGFAERTALADEIRHDGGGAASAADVAVNVQVQTAIDAGADELHGLSELSEGRRVVVLNANVEEAHALFGQCRAFVPPFLPHIEHRGNPAALEERDVGREVLIVIVRGAELGADIDVIGHA